MSNKVFLLSLFLFLFIPVVSAVWMPEIIVNDSFNLPRNGSYAGANQSYNWSYSTSDGALVGSGIWAHDTNQSICLAEGGSSAPRLSSSTVLSANMSCSVWFRTNSTTEGAGMTVDNTGDIGIYTKGGVPNLRTGSWVSDVNTGVSVNDTWIKLGFYYYSGSSIRWFINDVEQTTYYSAGLATPQLRLTNMDGVKTNETPDRLTCYDKLLCWRGNYTNFIPETVTLSYSGISCIQHHANKSSLGDGDCALNYNGASQVVGGNTLHFYYPKPEDHPVNAYAFYKIGGVPYSVNLNDSGCFENNGLDGVYLTVNSQVNDYPENTVLGKVSCVSNLTDIFNGRPVLTVDSGTLTDPYSFSAYPEGGMDYPVYAFDDDPSTEAFFWNHAYYKWFNGVYAIDSVFQQIRKASFADMSILWVYNQTAYLETYGKNKTAINGSACIYGSEGSSFSICAGPVHSGTYNSFGREILFCNIDNITSCPYGCTGYNTTTDFYASCDDAQCAGECLAVNALSCYDPTTTQICLTNNATGCLANYLHSACSLGSFCSEGVCTTNSTGTTSGSETPGTTAWDDSNTKAWGLGILVFLMLVTTVAVFAGGISAGISGPVLAVPYVVIVLIELFMGIYFHLIDAWVGGIILIIASGVVFSVVKIAYSGSSAP